MPSAGDTQGFDPVTGKLLWYVRHGGMNASNVPQSDGQRIFLQSGDGGFALHAVDPGNAPAGTLPPKSPGNPTGEPLPMLRFWSKTVCFFTQETGMRVARQPAWKDQPENRFGKKDWEAANCMPRPCLLANEFICLMTSGPDLS